MKRHYSITNEIQQLAETAQGAANASKRALETLSEEEAQQLLQSAETWLKLAKAHCTAARKALSK